MDTWGPAKGNPGAGFVLRSKWTGSQTLVALLKESKCASCSATETTRSVEKLVGAQRAWGKGWILGQMKEQRTRQKNLWKPLALGASHGR